MKYTKMNKNGISLIVLVITIIVMIIIAGAIILSLSNGNVISKAKEAKFSSDAKTYSSELTLAISEQYISNSSFNPAEFSALAWDGGATITGTVKQYISSMNVKDANKYVISEGKLKYIGTDVYETRWAKTLGLTDALMLWLDGTDFKNSPQTTTWMDKSGKGNNAVCYTFGYTTTSGSDDNGAVAFDGASDFALVTANFPSILTIETWAKAITIDQRMIWSFEGNSYEYGPDIYPVSGRLHLNICDGASNPFANQTAYPSLNVWHHYVVVFDKDSNIAKLYIDGTFIGNASYRDPAGPKLFIGRFDSVGYFWNGSIKSVKVYNVVLTDAEILKNYNDSK